MSGSMEPRGIPLTPVRHDTRRVRRWRRQWLVAAGFDELAAHRLARRDDTDLHALLVEQEDAVPSVVDDHAQRMRRHG
jgi:hypothetical protein